MSVSGIFSTSGSNPAGASAASYQLQNSQLQQLGQDLASGNLSAAQSDFATLQQSFAQPAAVTSSSPNPVAQAFQQLSTDLKSGNLSGAQKDYSNIQQNLHISSREHNHHRIRIGSGFDLSPLLQDLNQLGQASSSAGSQAANSTDAQQAYSTLQQQLQQFALGSGASGFAANLASSPVSLLA